MHKKAQPGLNSLLLVWSFLCFALLPAPAAVENPETPGVPEVIPLEERKLAHGYFSWGLEPSLQTNVFGNEPELAGRRVHRGTVRIASGNSRAERDTLAFIWDYAKGNLYLDLNQNRNLSDDKVLITRDPVDQGGRYYSQHFTNVTFRVVSEKTTNQLTGTVYLHSYGSRPSGSFSPETIWDGKISAGGQEWHIGVVEQFPFVRDTAKAAYLVLRPWSSRSNSVSVYGGSLETFRFTDKVFFAGKAHGIKWISHDKLEVSPMQPVLGELRIPGKFLQRVQLSDPENFTVILDKPGLVNRVPAGRYTESSALLQAGNVRARRLGSSQMESGPVAVTPGKPAVLTMGGPLTNSVSISRRGRLLVLQYQLLGAGGVSYELVNQDRSKPPTFEVFKGDRRLASGKFEFG